VELGDKNANQFEYITQ